MKIILGSGSEYRQKALTKMGYDFEVVTADIDEKAIRFDDPEQLTLALSEAKAQAIIPRLNEPAILITADQVIVCNGEIREKPIDEQQAREYLESYGIYPAEAVNGIMVINTKTGQKEHRVERSKVYFKPFPHEVIDQLIEIGEVYKRAGAFAAENPLVQPYVERVEGTLDSIGGFPSDVIREMIEKVSS